MKRRLLLQCGVAVLAQPDLLAAQTTKSFRVGCLWANDPTAIRSLEEAFVGGLRDHGYVVGRNLMLEMRYAHGDGRRFPALTDERVAMKPDVLVGIEPVAVAMRNKTTTIPIVLIASPDPVAAGLIKNLARPGTNVTGLSYRLDQLIAKHVELLTEIVPKISRIGLVSQAVGPEDPGTQALVRYQQFARAAAMRHGLRLSVVSVRDAESVRQAFAELQRTMAEAIVVASTAATYRLRREINAEARRLRLPSITTLPADWAEAGGLITYGPDWLKSYRYAANFVDRILKGANPAEIPVEQPESFEVVINLRTAREIGITLPASVLVRADRIID